MIDIHILVCIELNKVYTWGLGLYLEQEYASFDNNEITSEIKSLFELMYLDTSAIERYVPDITSKLRYTQI